MELKKKVPNWQKIGVFIGIISVIFNFYQWIDTKSKEKAWDVIEGRLIERVREGTARWLGAERRVAEREKKLVDLNEKYSVTLRSMQFHRDNSERYKEQSDKFKTLADYYENKYNEISVVLDLDDDEHFKFFLEWTSED